MAKEILIYTDESMKDGEFFANFYGGAAVLSSDLKLVVSTLNDAKGRLNLFGEVKWQKVTSNYLSKYVELIEEAFDLIQAGKLKIRIMFTHNYRPAASLDPYQLEHSYHILYYLFIKHGFGLQYALPEQSSVRLRLYLDKLPDTREKNSSFKGFLRGLQNYAPFRSAGILIPVEHIAEVRSHDHVILQILDVILGAMQFRLNDKHKAKPVGSYRRGKRTIAKEKLFKKISKRIRLIYPGFNIGISTGLEGDRANRWQHPYRHWCFTPRGSRIDETKAK